MYANERDEINYHGFLFALRNMQKAKLVDVAKGICTKSEMDRVEMGERQPEKLMRDRISARLGVSGEEYEDYLSNQEYDQWKCRQRILKALERNDYSTVRNELEAYKKIADKNCVQKQFIETMQYLVAVAEGAPKEELLTLLQHAIAHTVPNIEKAISGAHLLADQEINLIVEYISLKDYSANEKENVERKLALYEKVVRFIEKSYMDDIGKSKILPRIACKAAKLIVETEDADEFASKVLPICHDAIEILRIGNRLFNFVEVLEYHSILLLKVKPYAYKKLIARNTEWIENVKELYVEHGRTAYTENFGYLYWESECHSIVDVLEVRRGMVGISRLKLAGEICDEKTIIRYERYGFSPKIAIVRDLFEQLGLCAEYKRARVITSNPDDLELADKLAGDINNYNIKESLTKIEMLKENLDMNLPFNKQEITRMENIIMDFKGEVREETLAENLLASLEETISFENICRKEDRYLTRAELKSMHNLSFHTSGKAAETCRSIIGEMCLDILEKDIEGGRVPVYELLVEGMADYLGDIGDYEKSSILCEKLLTECLNARRMYSLSNFIYHNLWNQQEMLNKSARELNPETVIKVLKRCKVLSEINHRTSLMEFFSKKIKEFD